MFTTKLSVDKHVSSVLARIRDEKERNNRGYQIAKLYYEVKEYEVAKRYLAGFLSVKESFAPAHKLLGQILEGLHDKEKALTAYKRSLEIDDKQKDVLLKICGLYLQMDIDPERAKYWAERAEKVWPRHDTVFKLREKIFTDRDGEKNSDDLENLIASELIKRPKDPNLRAKLLRLYIDTGRINEAYDHAVNVERKGVYPQSLEWYQCLQDVFQVYQDESGEKINGIFHQNLMMAQSQLCYITLEKGKVADVADCLHKFDQTIQGATKITGGEEWNVIFKEMQAQLYFFAGTLLLKRAQQDHLGWLDAVEMASACFTASYAYEPPHAKAAWFAKAPEEDKKIFSRLIQKAQFRSSQTGHMMRHLCKGDSQKWISCLKESQFGEKGRGRLYDTLFTLRQLKGFKSSSFLYQGSALSGLMCVYPTDAQLKDYDKGAHLLHGDSLHHLVWLAMQYYSVRDRTQPNYKFSVFADLQYSITNLDLPSPESLCQLDTEAFLYATVRTVALQLREQQRLMPANSEIPTYLPTLISNQLCTKEQEQWWSTAFRLFNNTAKENLGKLRLVLQRGIECVRLSRNHGMDVSLVIHIARTFEERVEELKAKGDSSHDFKNEIDHLLNRALQYWKEACEMMERIQRSQVLPSPKQKLFTSHEPPLTEQQIQQFLEEGKFFLACDAMKHGEDELAIEMFERLNMPDASYFQALVLSKMADDVAGNTTRGREAECDEQEVALLTRARDALYLTMDRTRDNKNHKLAPRLASELDEIESRLNRFSLNKTGNESRRSEAARADTSDADDVDLSSKVLTTPSAQSTPHPKSRPMVNISLGDSPRKPIHTQPSPERLDAQIRSLSFSQETLIKQLMDRNEELVKQNAAILAELSASRKLIEKLMTARTAEPACYPIVAPPPGASPIHGHPALTGHPIASAAGPHAASTPPRHIPPGGPTPAAASPYYGSPYRPQPEAYDYAAYSPHPAYHIYPHAPAPPAPPLHHYGYPDAHAAAAQMPPAVVPAAALAGAAGKEPSAAGPVKSTGAHIEEDEDYYYYDEDDEDNEDDGEEGDGYPAGDPQQIQEWPYGNSVSATGKSTINYSPQRTQQPVQAQHAYFGQGPASTGLPMPGPGFFSSPERPTGAYNAGRYPAPGTPQGAGAGAGPSPQLHAPRPGFIGTIGSSVTSAQTPPRTATATQAGNSAVTGRSPAQTGTSTTEAALIGESLIKMAPQAPVPASSSRYGIPISSGVFTNKTTMNAVGSPISTVTTASGLGSKDVQPKSPGVYDEDDEDAAAGDDSYQGPDFEPIIPLPDEVEVKTGEEEEKVLFVARSKLYRYTENQWKERGIGDIKILWREDTGQARIVMRREQVLKVCANHYIQPNMKMDFKSDKETKILTWIGMDFSEGDGVMESFSCRFKTEDIATDFKAKFEEGKALVAKAQKSETGKVSTQKKAEVDTAGSNLFAKLKPKEGSWECNACYVSNPPEVVACLACTTPKPGVEIKTPQQTSLFSATSGSTSTGSFAFGSKPAATASAVIASSGSGFSFGTPGDKPLNMGGFSFNQTSTAQTASSTTVPAKTGFAFGTTNVTTSQTTTSSTGSAFSFTPQGTQAKGGFVFGTPSTTTAKVSDAKTTPQISPPKFTFAKPGADASPTPVSDALKAMAAKVEAQKEPEKSAPITDAEKNKPTFGGFTFANKPVVEKKEEEKKETDKKKEEKKEEEQPKVNPFASFSFVSPKPASKPADSASSSSDAPVVFGAKTSVDFASIAASKEAAAFTKKSDAKGFDGAGAKLFGGLKEGKEDDADESGHAEDYEPDVDFKPIIPLPDLVEVKTGEEDEIKLFGHRAKLYRHDNESTQWKERGVGEIKILMHRETGRCRVLMRREQVLKLCANHYITVEMSLKPLKTSDKAWCWYANDYSEDEAKFEQLAVRFKTADTALKFQQVFEQCQKELSQRPKGSDVSAEKKEQKKEQKDTKAQQSLGELFKPKAGQWECQGCYVQNKGDVIVCVACQTPKPGHEDEAAKQKAASDPFASGSKFAEGALNANTSGQTFTFGSGAGLKKVEGTPKTGFLFGAPSPGSLSFTPASSTPVSATTAESSGTPARQFTFNSSGFKFGSSPAGDGVKTPSKEEGSAKTFGLSGGGFSFTPTTTPAKQDKPLNLHRTPQSPEGDYYVNTDEEDSHIYFEPIVQLPEQVDLVTGEEDEEPLYCHRAKLYRYMEDQWKERGLGDVKILRHKETKKCRIVMRREQILKICLNHFISSSLVLKPMQNSDGKAWVWVATDFAEGEASDEKLAIKFKNAEIANEFKKSFDDAKEGKGAVIDLPPTPIKIRERKESSSRDSTRERKDSARERKDSAKERERRHSAGKSDSPDKVKTSTSLDAFSFKPTATTTSSATTSSPKVGFTFAASDAPAKSVFGGAAQSSASPGKFSFGSGASVSTGFNFSSPAPDKTASTVGPGGESAKSPSSRGQSLLAQMLMSDEPIKMPDVEITYEKKPTAEQVAKAAEFKLPSTFYNYEDCAPCPGCRGCEDDGDYHKDVVFLKADLPSADKVLLAEKYKLPKSFYLYEKKPPCPGCLGCYDDIEGKVFKGKTVPTTQKKVTEKAPEKTSDGKGADSTSGGMMFGAKTSNEFSFAAIAAKSPSGSFGFESKSDTGKPFSWADSGKQLFSNIKPNNDDETRDENEVVQSEDIHFEPLVQLEEVEVKTGEEDETAVFSQRSKLFRYTDGQWKERGVGDMKILKHKQTGRFRLLMRRDQIHKICCNHAITPALELLPMNTSEVAWCWFAVDFSEGEGKNEQFALKFKNQELAKQFKDKVLECQKLIELLEETGATGENDVWGSDAVDSNVTGNTPDVQDASVTSTQDTDHSYTSLASPAGADQSGANLSGYSQSGVDTSGYSQSEAEGGAEDDDYETDEYEDVEVLFSKRATMFYEGDNQQWKQIGMGELQVMYDDDVNANRIRMTKDDGVQICNHIICLDYHLQCNEKKRFVEWTAKDFSTDDPIRRTFRVQFSSKEAVVEFKSIFAEGIQLAKECEIREVTEYVPSPIFSEK